MKESNLNKDLFNYFISNRHNIYSEVPFMSRTIDLVRFEDKKVVTYELKIKNWRRAINQMLDHSIASHYCYLVMPDEGKSKELINSIINNLSQYGFGFILWDKKNQIVKEILTPKESRYRNKYATSSLIDNIKSLEACHK